MQMQNSKTGVRHFVHLPADQLWNVTAFKDSARPRCAVWSRQTDLFDVLLSPEEVAVVEIASVGGIGDQVGHLHQSVATGGECWQKPTVRSWSGPEPNVKGTQALETGIWKQNWNQMPTVNCIL